MASATIGSATNTATRAICNIFGGLPVSVSWRIDNQANIAEIQIPRKRFHEFRQHNGGKPVWIAVQRNRFRRVIFHGWLTGRYFEFEPNSEMVTAVCQGPRWRMRGDFLKGKYMLQKKGVFDVLSGLKTIFNEQIENSTIAPKNGAIEKIDANGVRPFSLDQRDENKSKAYSVNDMLWYSYFIGRLARTPDVVGNVLTLNEFGVGELGDIKPVNVNVDGMTITEAIDTIMKAGGLRWFCEPISKNQSALRASIAGPNATGAPKYFYLAPAPIGTSPGASVQNLANIATSLNNVESGRVNEDFADTYSEVYGFGARKIYQSTFPLKPAWNSEVASTLLSGEIKTLRKETREKISSNWDLYKDIGRKFGLDETGDISGEAYDFSDLFGDEEWAQTPRPFVSELPDQGDFQSPIITNPSLPEIKTIEKSTKLLETQAGIVIESDELDSPLLVEKTKDAPSPALASEAVFLAALPQDKALEKSATVDAAQSGFLVGIINEEEKIDRRLPLVLDEEYQTDNHNVDKEKEVEADLQAIVSRKLDESRDPRISASFSIPFINTSYKPGDIVLGIRGRNVFFTAQIVDVKFDLTEGQRTEISLEDLRLEEV